MIPRLSNISFKSIPIYDVKVKKKNGESYKSVDAVFSKLDPNNKHDVECISKIGEDWGHHIGWSRDIVQAFFRYPDDNIYTIELKGNESLYKRIITMSDVISYSDNSHIVFMQSKPRGVESNKDEFKGGGETMLYGIIKEAGKNRQKEINLFSRSNFWEYMGFTPKFKGDENVSLTDDKFKPFIKRVEEKYNFSNKGETK